jgi:predicted naringenin-chalcone synthase
VPTKIKKILKEFVNSLFLKANITQNESVPAIYAIHPGGPKIIDSVQEVLALSNEQIKESNKIFFERGNMSSATLPHIWNEIINNHYPIGTRVISLAFGPGLTLLGSIFEVC